MSRLFIFCGMIISTVTAVAADRISGNTFNLMDMPGLHPVVMKIGQYNPWTLPPVQRPTSFPHYYNAWQQNGQSTTNPQSTAANPQSTAAYPRYRAQPEFVTPEVLNNIKKQQVYTQQNHSPWQYNDYRYRGRSYGTSWSANTRHRSSDPWLYNPDKYKNPSSSSGLLTTPERLDSESLLFGGQSLPAVPDAAIGGVPPMNVFEPLPSELSEKNYRSGGSYYPFRYGPFGDFVPQ